MSTRVAPPKGRNASKAKPAKVAQAPKPRAEPRPALPAESSAARAVTNGAQATFDVMRAGAKSDKERARIDRMQADFEERRARAKSGEPPRKGWIEVIAPNAYGDMVPVQIPRSLHQELTMPFQQWRPGASFWASAAFLSRELNEASEAAPHVAELVSLAEIAGLVYLAALRFERDTLTDKDRGALRDAANALRKKMEPERVDKSPPIYREGPLPPRDPNEEPHVGPRATLPRLNRRERVRDLLAMADPELYRPSPAMLARHPGRNALEVWVHAIADGLAYEMGPRWGTLSGDKRRKVAFEREIHEKIVRASYLDDEGNPKRLAEVTREKDKLTIVAVALRHFEGMSAAKAHEALKSFVS